MAVRFAPSPTGRLHIGNLRTAWISHWWAKKLRLPWHLRFEDIDAARVIQDPEEGSSLQQLRDLAALGMVPDEIVYQRLGAIRHYELFLMGIEAGAFYPCTCSRKEVGAALSSMTSAPHGANPVYSGKCRNRTFNRQAVQESSAWRFKSPGDESGAQDFLIGHGSALDAKDFSASYNFACAADDYDGAFDLLVRAADLAGVLASQRSLQELFSRLESRVFGPSAVYHAALVMNPEGGRLEKRSRGMTLSELQSDGFSVARLVGAFDRSFQESVTSFFPERVICETSESLNVQKILSP